MLADLTLGRGPIGICPPQPAQNTPVVKIKLTLDSPIAFPTNSGGALVRLECVKSHATKRDLQT